MSISVGADWDMPCRDRAQIDLWRLPLLIRVNRGLALNRFADLTSRARVAVKRRAKLHKRKRIAISRTGFQAELLSNAVGQRHFAHELIAPGYGFAPRPTRRVAALPGFPRRHESFSVWIAVRHSVFLSVLAPIAQASYFYLRSTGQC